MYSLQTPKTIIWILNRQFIAYLKREYKFQSVITCAWHASHLLGRKTLMIQFIFKSEAKKGQALLKPYYKWKTKNTGKLSDLFKVIIDGKK